jgi:TonB family protein
VALPASFHIGPALGRLRLPVAPAVVSAIAHVAFLAIVIMGASMWTDTRTKPVFVVLTPSVAAIGSPRGAPTAPPVEEAPVKPPPTELPTREAPRDLPARDLPARDLPSRELPQRNSAGLPDRSLPSRSPAPPRPTEKELPQTASTTPTTAPQTPIRREVAAAPPPPPLGAASGSATGSGPLTLSVSDFPYAWYIRQIQGKIQEKWVGRAIPGQQPAIVFEIRRDGRLNVVTIDRSSGNAYYDQVALRAINDASPFPPLPDDFKKPVLRIGLQFVFDPTGG